MFGFVVRRNVPDIPDCSGSGTDGEVGVKRDGKEYKCCKIRLESRRRVSKETTFDKENEVKYSY